MRTLALDHGLARIGCAVCDPSGTVVSPIEVIEPPDAEAAAELVAAREVELVVVGLPRGLSGREGEQAEHARAFAAELAGLLGDRAPVETYDERLTTLMARQSRLAGAGAAEDSLAAAREARKLSSRCAAAGVGGDA